MFMALEQNGVQNHNIKTGNKSFERVEKSLNIWELPLKTQNSFHEEMKSRLVAALKNKD
jgi:hypothetical protein